MTASNGWQISVGSGMKAHFLQPSGPSKPGTDWAIKLHDGVKGYTVLVRAYAEDVTGLSAIEEGKAILGFLAGLIQQGWSPADWKGKPGELVYKRASGHEDAPAPTSFVPANALEDVLLRAYRGKCDVSAFEKTLIESKVVILLDRPIDETKADLDMNPLIDATQGYPAMPIFTSLERLNPITATFPDYQYAFQTDCRWLLALFQPRLGLVVNMGSQIVVGFTPEKVQQLKREHGIPTHTPPPQPQ